MAFPFAALAAIPEGYQKSKEQSQKIDQGDVASAGQAALGQWIQSQVPGASPIPTPQQSPQNPMQLIQGLIQRLSGGGQPQGQPQAPQPGPQGLQMGAGAPGGQPPMQQAQIPNARPMGAPMAPGAPLPGAGGPPPAVPAQPGGQGAGFQGSPSPQGQGGQPGYGGMTLQQLVQGIARSNPGIKDPRVLAAAVTQGMNLLKPEDQMMWRMAQMQNTQDYRNRSLDIREDAAGERARGEDERERHNREEEARRTSEFEQREANAPSKQKAAEADRQKDLVIGQIDEAIDLLKKPTATGLNVTGWSGTAERAAEFVGGMLPKSMGGTDKTTASDFQSGIRTIQAQLPRILLGVGRISAPERAYLDDIVRGLGGMTNPQTAASALEHIKTVLKNSKKDQEQAPQGAAGQSSQAVPNRPQGVPEGSAYSPSRRMWRDPQGQLYGPDGTPARE
jgi:hypothetical protein